MDVDKFYENLRDRIGDQICDALDPTYNGYDVADEIIDIINEVWPGGVKDAKRLELENATLRARVGELEHTIAECKAWLQPFIDAWEHPSPEAVMSYLDGDLEE